MSKSSLRPPAIYIWLELEAKPRVRLRCSSPGEEHRLRQWAESDKRVADLIELALRRDDRQAA